jgi:hypothetical protein
MMKVLKLALLALACWVAAETALLIRQARTAVVEITSTTQETRRRIVDLSQNASGTLIQAGLVLDQVRQAAESQQASARDLVQNSEKATRNAAETLERINGLVSRIDAEVVPEAARTLRTASESIGLVGSETAFALRQVTTETVSGMTQLTATSASAQATIEQANRLLADPHIPSTLAHVDATAANVEQTTANIAKATKPSNMIFRAIGWVWDKLWQSKAAF